MAYLKRTQYNPKPVDKYTVGYAVPKGNRQACYDPKTNTYTREACGKNILISQGIGNTIGTPETYDRAFSKAFSSAFA